ncbi:unnamed protein product [Zymoseptoria tritici ST99CH_1E4]|uniref:Uncharacterized protein n=1 Tax=Zymoseptoria tritici ST99CH_1E4 TaxID=1276532 RepID=A0A2H1H7T8_ZYMTR|nr:unnamed protein product [Zymoseptoria tritici ST99CH_1E4]
MPPHLLTAVDSTSHIHLIIGSNPLAGARCTRSLEVGAKPILVAAESAKLHYGLAKRIEEQEMQWLKKDFEESDLTTLGREEVDRVVDAVFVTSGGKSEWATDISMLCRRLRIPVNVVDAPNLCTFTLLSTHSDGPLQIGVTTSGKGCKLASRIRREIASSLPQDLGSAVERLGKMRSRIWEQDHLNEAAADLEVEDEESGQMATFNKLVTPTDAEAAKERRMRWLSQICEYWPLRRLASITDEDVDHMLECYKNENLATNTSPLLQPSTLDARQSRGRIILAGSGPGHPDLLTTATLKCIRSADLILADKLVPEGVLALVPRRTIVFIARKFPGNADKAQDELHLKGLEALRQGLTVLRLKQGDPYLYGRGAEEVDFFRSHGYESLVLPGVTSALSAPLFAQIPVTHRGVSDQVVICTGTGRKGASPSPPAWREAQTVVFLMALHRLGDLITSLIGKKDGETDIAGAGYPLTTPCTVIERASCPDQRILRTTLQYVCAAVEEEGSRPPGLLVVGAACGVLKGPGAATWVVEDGWRGLDGIVESSSDGFGLGLGKGALEELREVIATPGLDESKKSYV